MPELRVTLRHRRGAPRVTRAWYVIGDTAAWLEEISRWPTAHASLRLIPVARSPSDRTNAGALVIPENADFEASGRCLAYAQAAERLYVPVDADPYPALDESELVALFGGDYVYVWCPGAGLIACEESSMLQVHELVNSWPRSSRGWDRAVAGVAHPNRLVHVAPQGELTLRDVLDDGRDDIGSETRGLRDQPPSPAEAKTGILHAIGRGAARIAASAILAINRRVAKTADAPTWIDKLEERARQKLASIREALKSARHEELSRLLDLLKRDPDRGLRFAIPLGVDNHRGLTRPSGQLAERDADFDLNRLAGGRPAELWDVPPEYRWQLWAKYRELANREIRLGRYRRAAYIFAELLGDFESAASALRNGRHFREAAVLYRDRLKRPLDAAGCLEEGGLLAEAIAEYADLQQYEKVGDLYQRLDQPDEARKAYQRAVGQLRSWGDYLSAARLCEEKLADSSQAVAELEAGWPNSSQAIACVRSLFGVLGRHGWHDAAADRAMKLAGEAQERSLYVPAAHLLSELTGTYPNADVCERAGEAAKRVIGARLRDATQSEAEQLVTALGRLAPQDRLLARDGRRFVSSRPTLTRPAQTRPSTSAAQKELRVVHTFDVGLRGAWHTAVADGKTIFAAGLVDNRIVLARCDFEGNCERALTVWPDVPIRTDSRLVLAAGCFLSEQLGVYAIGEPPLERRCVFAASDRFPTAVIGGALQGTGQVWGVSQTYSHTLVAELRKSPVLVTLDAYGHSVATQSLPLEDASSPEQLSLPLPLHARQDRIYVGIGPEMLVLRSDHETRSFEFPAVVRAICGTAWNTLTRVAIALDAGAYLLWDHYGHHDLRAFAQDMAEPVIGFNRGGYLMAASTEVLEVYDTKGGKLRLVAESNSLSGKPVSILSGPRTDRFAVLADSGQVWVFEV